MGTAAVLVGRRAPNVWTGPLTHRDMVASSLPRLVVCRRSTRFHPDLTAWCKAHQAGIRGVSEVLDAADNRPAGKRSISEPRLAATSQFRRRIVQLQPTPGDAASISIEAGSQANRRHRRAHRRRQDQRLSVFVPPASYDAQPKGTFLVDGKTDVRALAAGRAYRKCGATSAWSTADQWYFP